MVTVVVTFHHSDRVFTKQFPVHGYAVSWIKEIMGVCTLPVRTLPTGIWVEDPETQFGHQPDRDNYKAFIPYHSIAEITIENDDES